MNAEFGSRRGRQVVHDESAGIGGGNHAVSAQLVDEILESVAFVYITQAGTIVEYNRAFLHLFDLSDRISGLTIEEAFHAIASLLSLIQHSLRHNQAFRSHLVYFECGQQLVYVLMDGKKMDSATWPGGFLFTAVPVGNVVSFETQMKRNDKLEIMGKIASGIAHEIRNPLTSIRGFLQVMQGSFIKHQMERENSYAQLMMDEIDKVDRVVTELLLLSKPVILKKEEIDVNSLLEDIAAFVEANASDRSIEVVAQLEPVPPVLGDFQMLRTALLNLVTNAIEAMENGGILTLKTNFDTLEHKVRISVSDTGLGIPPYMADRIFDAFYTTKDSGIGLGLPVSQRIVTEHGGDIRVYTKGYGSTFSIDLPSAFKE